MNFSLYQLLLISLVYLGCLFGVAWISERGWIPQKIQQHPAIYVLSLGVYASAWAFYGSVALAHQYSYGYLAIYLGISGAFFLSPVLLHPFLQLARKYQLTSLADVFAFRYRSQGVGTLTTLGLLIGCLPLLALQIQAVAESIQLLSPQLPPLASALIFCIAIGLFAILFGAKQVASGEKHEGLVFAMAFESLLKVIALLLIGGYLLFQVLGGLSGLETWLHTHQAQLNALHTPLQDGPWRTLLLIFFAAAIVMPHMYHMIFTENKNPRAMNTASWGVPLLLLLLSLPIPIILWAGLKLNLAAEPQYFTLAVGIHLEQPMLALLAYTGGLSAASGLIIVLTLALSGMLLNHVLLPLYQPKHTTNIYRWLRGARRWLIIALLMLAFVFYLLLQARHSLSQLGLISFVSSLQFLPAALSVLYWPAANKKGFIAGVTLGLITWFVCLLLPTFIPLEQLGLGHFNFSDSITGNSWHLAAIFALLVNTLTFAGVSLFSSRSVEETLAAETCCINQARQHLHSELEASSAQDFATALAKPLGAVTAQRELEQALRELEYSYDEQRPFALRRLRQQLQVNLSSLMGPSIAQEIISSFIPYKKQAHSFRSEDLHLIESRLEDYQSRLTGLAAELDTLRRFHRQTLQDLPLGVCSLAKDQEIFIWNKALEVMTGIAASRVIGSRLDALDEPWRNILLNFYLSQEAHWYKYPLKSSYESRWLNLHKAAIDDSPNQHYQAKAVVLLIEDTTETQRLESYLEHAERLASIGRLAAGVAHEIGNPVTGIACLAQNQLTDYANDPEILENSQAILEQTQRITAIVQSLMNFSHAGEQHAITPYAACSIRAVCQQAISLLELNKAAKEVHFVNLCATEHNVLGDQQRLVQVMVNLLSNARDASPVLGGITLRSRLKGSYIELQVEDQGHGIEQAHLKRIFEPFFTTKDPGQGTGLGMAMVFSIIEQHQGKIDIISPALPEQQKGTRIIIQLPAALTASPLLPVTQAVNFEV